MERENSYKFIVLETNRRRLLHPSQQQDHDQDRELVHKRPSGYKKCLFGKADPGVTRRMLQEQYALDQKRFLAKFGFDIETIENLERSRDYAKENIENDFNGQNRDIKTADVKGRKLLKARRKVIFNKSQSSLSQQFITDYYQAKKSGNLATEKRVMQPQQDCNESVD
ncbi:uncharacterized protein [Euwallacea fornicatus]|uniref:uncharacterized protein n=1 Tax=Euwallacea fornicatus TaxID=995702 RepID=UPI00338F8B36